jgi:hypothetical protein
MRIWLVLAALAAVLAVLLVPPLVSISRYKSRITQLVSTSLGRPVRLSSVELRLLPWPGFVLTDLTVEDDPAFGAEPVLHANTVRASIRLLSLWRGRLEIGTISVDEASLNLVRNSAGSWNLDPLFRTAAAQSRGAREDKALKLPYLEATNSRINIKNGLEKLPFSLVNADLSFWQQDPGDWRVRLRGQPARTDVSLDLADTGVVQLEARLRSAPQMRQVPVHLDLVWREAHLGQLSRLIIGSDPGWRGDLTGEMHLDGTAEAAQVKTRLRATGVHRAEFAPAAPLDFDANCGFVYHYSGRAIENLTCDSPLGDGHIRLAGDLPGNGQPKLSVDLQRIPVQAGLDLLRTMRSGSDAGLEAKGTVSGQLTYDASAAGNPSPDAAPLHGHSAVPQVVKTQAKAKIATQGPLTGSLAVEGFGLTGGGLTQPIQIAKMILEPARVAEGQPQALATSVVLPAGGSAPLAITARLALAGYQVTVHGAASLPRIRELARVAGIADTSTLDALAGDPATLDLSAEGAWLPTPEAPFSGINAALPAAAPAIAPAASEATSSGRLTGTVTLRNANWKSDALANHVEISQATLHLDADGLRWDPVIFSYGPLKGTASLQVPAACEAQEQCPPRLDVQFGELNASAFQAALLGAHKPGTLISTLIARFRPSSAPLWPRLDGTVKASALILGPITLHDAVATLRILPAGVEITALDGSLLGGRVHGSGTLNNGDKPDYALETDFEGLHGEAVCQLLGLRCTGGTFDGKGKVQLSGFTGKELASSAKGSGHFEWRHGAIRGHAPLPATLARFDRWSGDAQIANGAVTLQQSQTQQGARKSPVEAAVSLSDPPRVTFSVTKQAAKR